MILGQVLEELRSIFLVNKIINLVNRQRFIYKLEHAK